ncbi:MAG: SPOR domain-containing protein [Bdellovibrionaceae bacterium]|nr:SPOR domain-containing protein [Pseudobdellovibrionaceae bacterium]
MRKSKMGAKSDVAVKLVLVFFISLLSFSIGTYIGKKYSDNQHKLAQLEPATGHEAKRSVASENNGGHGKEQMISDDEIKNLADEKLKKEEFIADDSAEHQPSSHADSQASSHADPHAKVAVEKSDAHSKVSAHGEKEHREPADTTSAPVHKAQKHREDAPLEAAKEFLEGKVPAPKAPAKVENRLPSSLPKDISQYALGKFTVQVASYATQDEAEKRAQKLKEQGYQTNVIPAKVNDKQWYRVSIGLYGTSEEAQTERTKYLEKYKTESALVQKIKN